jgi:DNA-nicking Smr family endonuclease
VARKLGEEEKALWGRVMATVTPMHPVVAKPVKVPAPNEITSVKLSLRGAERRGNPELIMRDSGLPRFARNDGSIHPASNMVAKTKASPPKPQTLDGTWDRQITKGALIPDVSVDLHGSGLSSAYTRLDGALEQAIAQKLRVVLLVTGRPRMHDRTTGEGRGAIASVVRDWLAASRHSSAIAAVRGAHPRHGGAGALYIVLKR